MKNRLLTNSTLVDLFHRLIKIAGKSLANPLFIKMIENYIFRINSTQTVHLEQHILEQIIKIQKGTSQFIILQRELERKYKIEAIIREKIAFNKNNSYVNREKNQQEFIEILTLLRNSHIEIVQNMLKIDQKYDISMNSSKTIDFFIKQINQLQIRFLYNKIIEILYHYKDEKNIERQQWYDDVDPFLIEIKDNKNKYKGKGQYENIFYEKMRKKQDMSLFKKLLSMKHKINSLRFKLQNPKKYSYELSKTQNLQTIQKGKILIPSIHQSQPRRYSLKLSPLNSPQRNSISKDDHQTQRNLNLNLNLYKSRALSSFTNNDHESTHEESEKSNFIKINNKIFHKNNKSSIYKPIKKFRTQIDQEINQNHSKELKFYQNKDKVIDYAYRPNKNQKDLQQIREKQQISYNPVTKQQYSIKETDKVKYVYDFNHDKIHSLEIRERFQMLDKSIQTLNQLQSEEDMDLFKEFMLKKQKKQREISHERDQIKEMIRLTKMNTKNNGQHAQDQETVDQGYLIQEKSNFSNKINIKVVDEDQLKRIHHIMTLQKPLEFSIKSHFVGKKIKMMIPKKTQQEMSEILQNLKIAQEYQTAFKVQKLQQWISKNQTFYMNFTINNKTAIDILFSSAYKKTLILKLWAPTHMKPQQSQYLFSHFLQYLSTVSYFQKLLYIGPSFNEIQASQFKSLKENMFLKEIPKTKAENAENVKLYLTIQLLFVQNQNQLKKIQQENSNLFVDRKILQKINKCIPIQQSQKITFNADLQLKTFIRTIKNNKSYLKEILQFKASFIVNYPFYYFSEITVIETIEYPIFRIPITVNEGFLYFVPYLSIQEAIEVIYDYDRTRQYRKDKLCLRMFKKKMNFDSNKVKKIENEDFFGIVSALWQNQNQVVMIQTNPKKQYIFDVYGSFIIEIQNKIGLAINIQEQDYIY